MKKIIKALCQQVGKFYSFKRLSNINTPCFLPLYHVISDDSLPYIKNYPYRNISQFERELDFILKYFKPVELRDLPHYPHKKNIFHLSFDDGLRECAEIIAPILLRKGVPATFFINTAFINNKSLFHKYKASLILNSLKKHSNNNAKKYLKSHNLGRDNILSANILQTNILDRAAHIIEIDFNNFLSTHRPYLSSTQIKNLSAKGFTLGAHSHTHPEFWIIPKDEQIKEIQQSISILHHLINQPIKVFAFPFTDDRADVNILKDNRLKNYFDLSFGTAGIKFDEYSFHLQRYPMEQNGNFISKLKGEYIYYKLRKWIGKSTVIH